MKTEACFTGIISLHLLNLQGMPSEESEFGILHLHLQPLEMKRVGVVFTPADYGKVTSLILIRWVCPCHGAYFFLSDSSVQVSFSQEYIISLFFIYKYLFISEREI